MSWPDATQAVDAVLDAVIEYIPESEISYVVERVVTPFLDNGWVWPEESRYWIFIQPLLKKRFIS